MKSVNEIKLLLEKFYDGTTSSEEELAIKEFFVTCDDISDDMKADKEVFDVLINAENDLQEDIVVPMSLESDLSKLIDDEARKERPVIEWWTLKRISGIAASICIIALIGVYLMKQHPENEISKDEILFESAYIPQTEEEALEVTERTFLLMSERLSQGFECASLKLEQLSEN